MYRVAKHGWFGCDQEPILAMLGQFVWLEPDDAIQSARPDDAARSFWTLGKGDVGPNKWLQ